MDINIGNLIRQGRLKKGLTQHKLAEVLHVDSSSVSRWENNEKIPSGDTLIELVILLELVPELFPGFHKTQPSAEIPAALHEQFEKVWQDNKKLWQVIRLLEGNLQRLEEKMGK